jgi:hypothetical protein
MDEESLRDLSTRRSDAFGMRHSWPVATLGLARNNVVGQCPEYFALSIFVGTLKVVGLRLIGCGPMGPQQTGQAMATASASRSIWR